MLAHLEQWSLRKAPRELEGWGFKKGSVSPSIGQPKLPLGTGPSLKNNGKKWFKMRPNTNPNVPTIRTSQKPPAIEESYINLGSLAIYIYSERERESYLRYTFLPSFFLSFFILLLSREISIYLTPIINKTPRETLQILFYAYDQTPRWKVKRLYHR